MRTAAARVNISVSPELKDRMARASASNIINWSAFARHGFETALASLERVRSDQRAAIVRLRASKLQAEQQDATKGRTDGRDWAERFADYRALRRLQASVRRSPDLSAWDCLRKSVDPYDEHSDDEVSAHLFFGDKHSDYPSYPTYVRAFIEGALAAWVTIADDVDAGDPAATDYLPQLGPYVPNQCNANLEAMAAALAERVTTALGR